VFVAASQGVVVGRAGLLMEADGAAGIRAYPGTSGAHLYCGNPSSGGHGGGGVEDRNKGPKDCDEALRRRT